MVAGMTPSIGKLGIEDLLIVTELCDAESREKGVVSTSLFDAYIELASPLRAGREISLVVPRSFEAVSSNGWGS